MALEIEALGSQSIDLERKPKEHSTIDKWDVENLKPGSDTEFKETDLIHYHNNF